MARANRGGAAPWRRREGAAAGGQGLARAGGLHLGDGDDVAHRPLADLLGGRAVNGKQAPRPRPVTVWQDEVGVVGQGSAEYPGVGEFASLTRVRDLKHIGAGAIDPEPGGGPFRIRRLVAQGLQQAADAKSSQGRTEEHWHDQALVHVPHQIGEHQVAGRIDVGEQLLHQGVVEVGQLFEHMEPGVGLDLGQFRGQLDHFGRLSSAPHVGALERQIDEAGDVLALDDRQLARHQGRRTHRRQGGQQGVDRSAGLVHAVHEQGPGHAKRLELTDHRLDERRLGRIRIGDHDGQVHRRQSRIALGGQFQGAGQSTTA